MYENQKEYLKKYLGSCYDTFKKYNVILAGGAITSLFTKNEINDFDIYFRDKMDIFNFVTAHGACISSGKAYTFSNRIFPIEHKDSLKKEDYKNIQAISFGTFKNAEEIFNLFDFTVCMGAFDFKTEEFILDKRFLLDNASRSLVFNKKTKFPLISAIRVDKYKERGYNINKSEMLKILLSINAFEIKSLEELKEQLGGFYGDEIVEIKDSDGNFDLFKTIDNIEYKGIQYEIEEVEHLELAKQLGIKFNLIKIPAKNSDESKKDYILCNEDFDIFDFTEEDLIEDSIPYEIIDMSARFFKPRIVYKEVLKKQDGKLVSNNDNRLEYKIGQIVEPLNKENVNSGIYFYFNKCCPEYNPFYHVGEKVIIKLKVNIEDIYFNMNTMTFRADKAFVLGILEEGNDNNEVHDNL